MKIGLLTGEFPPMEGGVGAFTQELGRALAQAGHEIHIITSREARPADLPRKVSQLLKPVDIGYAQLHPQIQKWRWPALSSVADVMMRYELDVVNIQYQAAAYEMRSPAINMMPWRLKNIAPVVVTYHDLRVPYLFPKAGRLRETAVSFMAKQAHGVIVTNPDDYEALNGRIHTPLTQIPIGSNITANVPNHIEMQEVRDSLGLRDEDCLLGYFGFLNESKGANTLIQAVSQLDKRYHLVFIGGQTGTSDTANNAAFLNELKAQIDQLDLTKRVHWTGFLSDQRVSAHLHAADLMVMPYRDGSSLRRGTLMAALAHGRPLITTWPTISTPELNHRENCWFVPVDDPEAIVEAITKLMQDTALRTQLGSGATAVADLFTWDKIAAQTADFFSTL
ncbi:MAG: glycosyltransferase family 4 protein [Chloroflexi bacterium]|nr:glycosyltransferase family 4 protein [Chloroflexota bacterium]